MIRRPVIALLLCFASSSCFLFHGDARPETDASLPADHDAGEDPPVKDAGTNAVDKDAGRYVPWATPGAGPAIEPSNVVKTEVWVGELWSLASNALCDPRVLPADNGPNTYNAMGFTARVVLILDVGEKGEIGGRVQFGDSEAELPNKPDYVANEYTFWLCSIQSPTRGFEYTLFDVTRAPGLLSFAISPNQVWNHACEVEKPKCSDDSNDPTVCDSFPTCVCDSEHCSADLRLRWAARLVMTADTLEAEVPLLGTFNGTPPVLRLRRAR